MKDYLLTIQAYVNMALWLLKNTRKSYTVYNGIKVILDDTFMRSYGFEIACAFKFLGFKFIVVDSTFPFADESIKAFLLAHEYAHLTLEDAFTKESAMQKQENRIQAILDGRVYAEELMADAYAVSVIGAVPAVHALNALKETLHPFNGFGIEEIELRIQKIQEVS